MINLKARTLNTKRKVSIRGPRQLEQYALVPVIVVAMIIGTLLHPVFLSQTNIINVLRQSSELSILVLAEALILIAGKFDLSLESIVGLAPMLAAWLVSSSSMGGSGFKVNSAIAILVLFLVGIIVGTINGILVVRLKLNAFIATLAMLILLRGVTIGISGGKTMYDLPSAFLYLGTASIGPVPISVILSGVLFIIAGTVLKYHKVGRALYAIGGNSDAARASGIKVDKLVLGVFIFAGGLSALAGLMLTGRLASSMSSEGQNMIFTVMAAAVIGRISLNGGRGSMVGALSGVVLLGIVSNILILSNIQPFWISAVYGFIILLSLLIARFTTGVDDSAT